VSGAPSRYTERVTSQRQILILLAHPTLERSRINRRLIDAVSDLKGVTVHDLYETYPALNINVRREQQMLLEHDVIVFQHPFYWYSTPAILKEWQDLVLEHGWAYGNNASALRGKITFNALTAAGTLDAYREGGANRYSIRQLIAPYELTARLCGMQFLAPFVVYGALAFSGPSEVVPYEKAYRSVLEGLRDNTLDVDAAARAKHLHGGPA
jgi:glutathione-regulated potassium-efflux system ancillary protein KefG